MRVWVHVDTFQVGTDKERAKKVAEEGTEAYGAWEAMNAPTLVHGGTDAELQEATEHLFYECCDTIQAACNLMASLGATQQDIDRAMDAVRKRNEERGRYR